MSRQSIIHVCLFFAAWLFSPIRPDSNLSKALFRQCVDFQLVTSVQGKSLSLICSSLTWLREFQEEALQSKITLERGGHTAT